MKFCLGALAAFLLSFSANAYAVAISSCESEYETWKLSLEQVNDDVLITLINKDFSKQADYSEANEPKLKLGYQESNAFKIYNTTLQDFTNLKYTPRGIVFRLLLGRFDTAGEEDMASAYAGSLVSRLNCK